MANGKFSISVQLLAQMDQFNKNMGRAGKSLNQFQNTIQNAFATTALVAFGNKVLTTAGDFENSMARVGAVSNATGAEMKALTDIAREMGATTQYSATQAAKGLQFLAMAGLSASDAVKALPSMLDLATAGAIELGEAADIATNIMSGFGLGVDELQNVVDVLATTATSSNTTILELGEGMTKVGAAGKRLGVDIKDASLAMALMANSGIKGETAGTALAMSLSRLLRQPAEVKAAFEALNITIDESTIKQDGLVGTLNRLKEAGITTTQMADVFGQHWSKMSSIIDATKADVDKLTAALDGSSGAAQRMADRGIGDYTRAVNSLKSATESLFITMGNDSGAAGLVDGLTGVVRVLDSLADTLPVVNIALAGLITKFGKTPFNKVLEGYKKVKAAKLANIAATKAEAAAIDTYNKNQSIVNNSTLNRFIEKYRNILGLRRDGITTSTQARNQYKRLNAEVIAHGYSLDEISTAYKDTNKANASYINSTVKAKEVTEALNKSKAKFIGTLKGIGSSIASFAIPTIAIAGIFSLVGAITDAVAQHNKLRNEIKSINKDLTKETSTLTQLVSALGTTNKGTEERAKLIESLNSKYGKYYSNLLTEKSTLEEVAEAYKKINDELVRSAAARAEAKAIENAVAQQTKLVDSLQETVAAYDDTKHLSLAVVGYFSDLKKSFKEAGGEISDLGKIQDKLTEGTAKYGLTSGQIQRALLESIAIDKRLAVSKEGINKQVEEYNKITPKSTQVTKQQISTLQKLYNEIQSTEEALKKAKEAGDADEILKQERAVKSLKTAYEHLTTELSKAPVIKLDFSDVTENNPLGAIGKTIDTFNKSQKLKLPDFTGTGELSSSFDTYTEAMRTARNEMLVFGDGFTYIQQQIQATVQRLEALSKAPIANTTEIDNLKLKLDELNQKLREQEAIQSMNGALNEAAAGGFAAFGKAMADAATGAQSFGESLLSGTMSVLGSALQSIGEALIAYGLAMEAFKKAFSNPWAAIAAGGALIAAGAMLSSMVSSSFGGSGNTAQQLKPSSSVTNSSSILSSGEYNSATGSVAGLASSDRAIKLEGEFRIKGTDLVLTLEKNAKYKSNF